MRVISGTAKGARLKAPKSLRVRPALDKVKEAIFDILYDVRGERVLDLFAGSGSIGIEALSRGAAEAVFVEEWRPALDSICANLERTDLMGRARVMRSKVAAACARLARQGLEFDLIFVDPPYLKNLVNPTLKIIARRSLLAEGGVLIVEHHPREPIEAIVGLALTDSRRYGQTLLSFLRRDDVQASDMRREL